MSHFRPTAIVLIGVAMLLPGLVDAGEPEAKLEGSFVANGAAVELPHVYVYQEDQGFYDEEDPTWTLLFVETEMEARDLDDPIWESAYIRLGVTESAEFGDEPELQVYSQDIRFSGDQGGNVSGGTYPEIELEQAGPDRFVGRVYHGEDQEIFDDTFRYDFKFSVPLSDPSGPIGDPLPADGGEPGAAYRGWCEAVHSGELERLKAFLPEEQRAMLDDEEVRKNFAEELEFMQMMTPTDLEIVSGSSDGETAILNVTGKLEGEEARGEIMMIRYGDGWIATESAWE